MSRWTRSTISPARPRPCITSSIRCRRPRPACIGAINMLGLAKRVKAQDPPGLDLRGLRRSDGASADRRLLGQRQPDRAARLLRRRQALRRDAVLRLSPPARLRIKVVRIFNTYGPRMHPNDGRVVSNFIVQALRGEDITLYGDGAADARLLLRRRSDRGHDAADGHRRRASPVRSTSATRTKFTVRELAEHVVRADRIAEPHRSQPLPQDDPRQRRPDITLARKLLGWAPTVAVGRRAQANDRLFRGTSGEKRIAGARVAANARMRRRSPPVLAAVDEAGLN